MVPGAVGASAGAALPRPRGRRGAAVVALVALGVLVLLYLAYVGTALGQRLDVRVLVQAQRLPFAADASLARVAAPVLLALLALVVGPTALVRRDWRSVVVAVLAVPLSAGGATLLKRELPRPDLGDNAYGFNTFPSVHVATTAALCLAVLILCPAAWESWVTPLALVLLLVACVYNVTGFAHRPSDVAAGLCVATAVAAALRALTGDAPGEAKGDATGDATGGPHPASSGPGGAA